MESSRPAVTSDAGPSSAQVRAVTAERRSPLHSCHVELGAKMVPFGGWEMPLSYPSGTVSEHRTCRTSAVAFDVSHLGTVQVRGPHAFEVLQRALTNDLRKIGPRRAQYTHLLASDASVVDDIIVWWVSSDRFDVMPNASNTSRVREALGGDDTTGERAIVAIQGPEARARLATVSAEAAAVPHFGVSPFVWRAQSCLSAGTGYTGEDGVECAVPVEVAESFWRAVMAAGIQPAGLGARDTLRLEAGLPLHGHELGDGITPLQAGLGWVIGWDKGEFTGRDALEAERAAGPWRRLRGLLAGGRQPARQGAAVSREGRPIGTVTSGNFSPMLERGIALAFINTDADATLGDSVELEIRGRGVPAVITRTPFWSPKGGS